MPAKRVVIFGATGGTGRALVQQALDRGHLVTAFVRDESRLSVRHERLRIMHGDVLRPEALPDALQAQDVVLCALGRRPFVSQPVCSAGTKNILDEMARQGIRTVIVESSVGVGDSLSQCGGFQKLLFRTVLRSYFADKAVQEQHVRESDLAWMIVRPVILTDGPATDTLRASGTVQFRGFESPSISRADVARFMLDQLEHPTFLHQCPILY